MGNDQVLKGLGIDVLAIFTATAVEQRSRPAMSLPTYSVPLCLLDTDSRIAMDSHGFPSMYANHVAIPKKWSGSSVPCESSLNGNHPDAPPMRHTAKLLCQRGCRASTLAPPGDRTRGREPLHRAGQSDPGDTRCHVL